MTPTGGSDLLDPTFLRRLEGLTLRARRLYPGQSQGGKRSPRRGAGLEFADHRAYVAGDDLRHLDWPLFARLRRPFIKTYEQEQDLPVHMLLDASRSMAFGEPAKWRLAARLAAALAHIALASLDRVGAAVYDGWGLRPHEPLRGQGAFFPLLRFLEKTTPDGPPGGLSALKLHAAAARPGLTIVLSDFLDRDFADLLRHHLYRRHSLVLIQVLAPQELEPPIDGDFELRDNERDTRVDVSVGPRELAAYRARLEAHRGELRQFGQRYGAEVFSFSSAIHLEEALKELLRGSFLGSGSA